MNYPGNASLAAPVKDRVVSTFKQTLELYRQGRREDVSAGCSLILQMDPTFEPARRLLEKLRNPAAPIDVESLLPDDARPAMDQAREAMAARDFERVIHLTTEILTNDLMNDDARILGDEAREKIEAGPFIDQFVRKCDQQIAAGNLAGARAELEKARSLDADHPEVLRVMRILAARASGPRPAAASPSFVVDDAAKQATGRAAAPASDFGFTFEEDKPSFSFDSPSGSSADSPFSGFSFGSPAPAAAPPPPAEAFDFSTASVSTTPDDQKKIEQYLADGDRAFNAGDYQQAIDFWSRIFLIDVTNDQASDRIERAKSRRRDVEQKVEALVASATTSLDRRDEARARADLAEALRLDPNHLGALEAQERLNAAGAPAAPAYAPPPDDKIDIGFFDDEPMASGIEAPLVPPSPFEQPAPAAKETKKKTGPIAKPVSTRSRKAPMGLIVTLLAILALAAGGWYVWTRFLNKPDVEPAATEAIFARANMLAGRGKIDEAIAVLQDVKPTDPQHEKALVMIADLRQKKNKSAQMIDGKPAAQYYEDKLAAALQAFEGHDYARAKAAFEEAQRVKPLPPDAKSAYDTAAEQVAKLDAAKALFGEQKYSEAIANLQPLLDQDPQNANVRRLIVDAHFNLGAQALQEERIPDAIREFDEVLRVNPDDELARRSRELAVRYDDQRKDLLYRIYVKYLPMRQPA